MAKERVQVQGLGDVAPGITPTIQRAGQYSVAQLRAAPVQAPRSKLLDLAEALGTSMEIVGQYGKLKEFEFKKGQERGEMEAATADLEQSIEGLDATGEKLVEQGLLPRSQLVGYQRSFRRRIGQRYARKTYASSLEARMEEVTQNLDSDEDIIENIVAEERQRILEQLGGSQFAMQGFGDYADSIENSFYNNAVKQRDKATQEYNESLVIEDANDTFPDQILKASEEGDYKDFENNLKTWMEERSTKDRIPRSRMVELIWNGFAVPNIRSLLTGDNPQPDKAESILDAITNVDLTGKGGKLGNINREKAAIKSTTITFKDQIAKAREKIENDTPDIADRIKREYGVNAPAIAGGPTGDAAIDERSIREITAQLVHAGYSEDEASSIATQVYSDSDVAGYTRYLSKFLDSEDTRAAFGDAFMSFSRMRLETAQLGSMYLTNKEQEQLVERYRTLKETNPDLSPAEFLNTGGDGLKLGPITDKQARATIGSIDLEYQKKKWWSASEPKRVGASSFKGRLRTNTEALYMDRGRLPTGISPKIDQLIEPYETTFINLYNNLTRDAAAAIDPDNPEREQLMLDKEKEISEKLLGRFTRLQETIKIVETRSKQRAAEVGFDAEDFNAKLEEAEEDVKNLHGFWSNAMKEAIFDIGSPASFLGIGGVFDVEDDPTLTLAERDYEFRQLTGARSPMREKALQAAEKFEMSLRDEGRLIEAFDDKEAPKAYKDTVKLLRKRFGYRSIDQVPDYDPVDPLDWRLTPVVGKEEDLRPVVTAYKAELEAYYQLPIQEQNIEEDKFSTLRKMRDKFGVFDPLVRDSKGNLTMDNLRLFIETQRKLFNP